MSHKDNRVFRVITVTLLAGILSVLILIYTDNHSQQVRPETKEYTPLKSNAT